MASTYLTRSMSGNTPSTKMTFSAWIKKLSNAAGFSARLFGTRLANHFYIYDDNIYLDMTNSSGTNIGSVNTSRVLRDNNFFYHLVGVVDTTLSTATDRVKIYVNGERATDITVTTQVSQNATTDFGANGVEYSVGARTSAQGSAGGYFNGVMAHAYYCDGYAYQASDFGQTDATTGIWKPKAFSGSYGTNGFFLKFENSGSLGTDSSGNGNNFTVNGTPTQTVDTPSNVFCTLNNLSKVSGVSLTNGNLTETNDTTWRSVMSTLAVSKGKWYWEAKVASLGTINFGITKSKQDGTTHSSVDAGRAMWSSNGNFYDEGFTNSTVSVGTFTTNDVIGLALDCDNGTLKFYKNNTLTYTFTNAGLTTNEVTPASGLNDATGNFNFGNGVFGTTAISSPYSDGAGLGKFQYQPPTGYYALCTKNINVYG